MSTENLEGKVTNGIGRAEGAAGELVDDPKLKMRGEARQVQGKVEDAVGTAKGAMNSAADQIGVMLSKAGGQARDIYDTARGRAQTMADAVDPFVKEKPYMALAIGLLTGVVIGGLFLNNASKVIYLKPARD